MLSLVFFTKNKLEQLSEEMNQFNDLFNQFKDLYWKEDKFEE